MTIDTREELIIALNEAAEVEHGLLVQYLFAGLTCKKAGEGLTPEQEKMVREWEGIILGVAVEEMGHLGTVTHLLSAIGAPPHFGRPNFPQNTNYYPFPFDLLPFGEDILYRFQIFELPRGMEPPPPPPKPGDPSKLRAFVPDPLVYAKVGELYEQIRYAFEQPASEKWFLGPVEAQQEKWSIELDVRKVVDRASAIAAINDIIEDGEGTPQALGNSHYARFTKIREQYVSAGRFAASRNVAPNPRIRAHRDAPGAGTLITNSDALRVAKLFAGFYGLILRLLLQFFSYAGEKPRARQELRHAASRLMSVAIRPIAEILTTMPIDDTSRKNAGPTFELFNEVTLPPLEMARWVMLFEHIDRLIDDTRELQVVHQRFGPMADTMRYVRRALTESQTSE